MADDTRRDSEEFDEGVGLPGSDQPGENLASEMLPDGATYSIAPDETEAEELDGGPGRADTLVEDAGQLAEAEAVAAAASSTRPVKRRNRAAGEAWPAVAEADEAAPATGGATAASLRPQKKTAQVAKKDHATPRRDGQVAVVEHKRVGPAQFVRESVDELRKVVWPTGAQLWQYFVVVLVFVLFIIAFVSLLDFAFGWALLKLLG